MADLAKALSCPSARQGPVYMLPSRRFLPRGLLKADARDITSLNVLARQEGVGLCSAVPITLLPPLGLVGRAHLIVPRSTMSEPLRDAGDFVASEERRTTGVYYNT